MSIISRMRKQDAVYWSLTAAGIKYDTFGNPVNAVQPIQIKCRWDGSQEEFLDSEGTKRMSQAVVFVDRDVDIGGYLFEGVVADLQNQTDPRKNSEAFEIKAFKRTPNLKATEFLLTAFVA